ncbi:D-alanyl-D-alanine carboxypeptidase family protein [Austwickia sp. TVS 96-490-7B]|uniref:D-alanyl-D-alanine carboxypeptidase family protein n=1 Tax=Austwickia sp. TVS 96-490-7B TaxID=2830843 RepID=UPI001C5A3F5C|nr:hypothetical protein [Austwickia sp. TVS 96-490-7B]
MMTLALAAPGGLISTAHGMGASHPSQRTAAAPTQDRLHEKGLISDVPAGVPAPPALPAQSFILADLGSGAILAAKGAHDRNPPASTMKLLTAQTLAPRLPDGKIIKAALSDYKVDGTRVGMIPDQDYRVDQLLQALLMGSANDAAEALARGNGGLEPTVQQMAERAAALGAKDTTPKTPHGLDAKDQLSSVHDLVLLLRGALEVPKLAKIFTMQTAKFPGRGTEMMSITSQNKLLWNYQGTIGGKDGFTDAAGHTYVGAVRRGGRTYAVAFMGAKSNDWQPSGKLLDWAFRYGTKARPVGQLPGANSASPSPSSTPSASATDGGNPAVPPPGQSAAPAGPETKDGSLSLLTIGQSVLTFLGLIIVAVVILRARKLHRDAQRRLARRERVENARQQRLESVRR